MRGERLVSASAYGDAMRVALVQHCVTLLGTMVPKYGSAERAFEMFAESVVGAGGMSRHGFASLIADVAAVAELTVSDQECVALMRLMGAGEVAAHSGAGLGHAMHVPRITHRSRPRSVGERSASFCRWGDSSASPSELAPVAPASNQGARPLLLSV